MYVCIYRVECYKIVSIENSIDCYEDNSKKNRLKFAWVVGLPVVGKWLSFDLFFLS